MELSNYEFKVLHALDVEAGLHAYEIAKRTDIKKTSIYNLMKQMVKKGFVNVKVSGVEEKTLYYHSIEGHSRYLNQRVKIEEMIL